ncbi:MBL fold metallo-hydrolase [Natrarchaeobius oligotrophus]|uniref:MBL fold metallo-hydrolase n=1 Tax=Natrarchaeobius chitinivorans TaxID=1679083 RepID=A0A3N6MED7_NATCH|nr:MBL fold metallo-hydrolase [Natrarchaeobius chitinivorans]RQG99204.1 MBL fold metallo-hydrolase [Natrarchaeobius chitinivorans]
MRVSYQHANVHSGNESTLLRFTADDGTRACVLVDSGSCVDLEELLEDDERLDAIVLTHAHIDHYRTLARNVRDDAPIYTSPATATILEHALPEATKDNALGDVSLALEALEPIDGWTTILDRCESDDGSDRRASAGEGDQPVLDDLEIRPVSAGHTPGAAGFVIRFRDESTDADLFGGTQHVLVTGDFTTRPCAGFPGLPTTLPFDVDCLLLNVSNEDGYESALDESLRTVLERAYAGSRVVVAASSLNGVQYATLLGHAAAAIDRTLPITLVGQAAKLYAALEYDVPGVETREVFERCETVLEDGGVTIAGPETAATGSARRLFETIEDDPAAVFVQLSTNGRDQRSNARCTTRSFPFRNHPSLETIDELVRSLAPQEVVIKHAGGDALNRFQRRFDRCFTWGTNDEHVHCLYEGGQWIAPDWIASETATRIRKRQWEAMRTRPFDADAELAVDRRRPIDLEAEGVDLEGLEAAFVPSSTRPESSTPPQSSTASARSTAPKASSDGGSSSAADRHVPDSEVETSPDDALVCHGADGPKRATDADGSERTTQPSGARGDHIEDELLARLEAIEAKLERSEETIRGRVLSDGDGDQFVRLLEPVDLEAGDVVELRIDTLSDDR